MSKITNLIDSKKNTESSGVYIFKNKENEIIYIGKAKSLKNRLSSYNYNNNPKIKKLKINTNKIEIINTLSEDEALIEEMRLIEMHKPKYNTLLKNHKNVYFVKLSESKYPSLIFKKINFKNINKNETEETLILFNLNEIETLKGILKEYFKIRDCSENFFKKRTRPCLEFEINLCNAPCIIEKIDIKNYNKDLLNCKKFLQKDKDIYKKILKNMELKMNQYSVMTDFKNAKIELHKINTIKDLFLRNLKITAILLIKKNKNYNGIVRNKYFVSLSYFANKIRLDRYLNSVENDNSLVDLINSIKNENYCEDFLVKEF